MRFAMTTVLLLGCGADKTSCEAATDATTFTLHGPSSTDGGSFSATLNELLENASLIIEDSDGTPLPGSVERNGKQLHFTPEAPLPDDTSYTISLKAQCNGDAVGAAQTVRTEDFVQAVENPAELAGQLYVSPGDSFYIVEPAAAVGGALSPYLHMVWLPMLRIDDLESGEVSMVWSTQDDPSRSAQKPCAVPVALEARWDNPELRVTADAIDVLTGVGTVSLYEFRMDATVSQDGTRLGKTHATAHFDLRDLYEELGYDNVNALCNDMDALDYGCKKCPDGAKVCLPLDLEGFEAERMEDIAVTDEDVCDLQGKLAVWGDDAVYSAEPGGTEVEKVDFDGNRIWTVDLGLEVSMLTFGSTDDAELMAVVTLANGTTGFWDINPEDGAAEYHGAHRNGDVLFYALVAFLAGGMWGGGGFGLGCNSAVVSTGWAPVWLAFLWLGLRRRRGV